MLQTRIFPCLLLKDQGLVKTVRFDNPTYIGDPLNAVRIFNTKEVDELLLLDITATQEGRKPNIELIKKISDECSMPLTVGGGINSIEDIRALLNAGVEKIAINAAAVENIHIVTEAANEFGSQAIIASIDVKCAKEGGHKVITHRASRSTDLDPVVWAKKLQEAGAGEILLYSVDRDGTMEGYDVELIRRVSDAVTIPVIACGGCGKTEDFAQAVRDGGASAVTAGSYFVYHGKRKAVLINFPTQNELAKAFEAKSNGLPRSAKQQKLLFYLNHPAHYHLFRNTINRFKQDGYPVDVVIVKKDVLEQLTANEGWSCVNLFPEGRRSKNLPILLTTLINLFKTEYRLWKLIRKHKPNILIGTEGTLAHMGFIFGIPSLLFNEDDSLATPENYICYPFATKVVLPQCCDKDKWSKKKITYNGYHELAYLDPKYFTPDEKVVETFNPGKEPYFILRLAELSASHDIGMGGISDELAKQIIDVLSQRGKVFITAERPLKEAFEPYRISIKPKDMVHALSFAQLYVGDSQTMAAEAAVLGTPSIRFNDFVGRLGYLEELEHVYQLTYGVRTKDPQKLLERINEILLMDNAKEVWRKRAEDMLKDKVDVVEFMDTTIKSFIKDN